MSPFPGVIVRWTKHVQVVGGAGEGKHRDGIANPYAACLQLILPPANVLSLVVFREDEIGLHPGNPCPGINEQLGKPVCAQPAALVQIVPPLLRDGLNAALHRYAMRSSKQVQSALIPQVNARLQPNGDGTLCQALQQAMKAAADTEDFIDKVDI